MNTKLATMVAALALGLGGCATDPGMGGMVYRDGGYYAPAHEGYGDYYVAPDHSDDWAYDGYYDPFYDPFYGPFYDPFVFGPNWYGGGGGYCSARYRYCPAGWYDGFGSAYYGGGFGGGGFGGGGLGGGGFWLSFGGRGGHYDPWGYSEQPVAWRPPQHRRPPPAQGAQSPPWRPPGSAGDGLANAGSGDADAPETGADGRFVDGNGDGRPDQRPLRRRLLRQQPTWAPLPLGSRPAPPNPSWPVSSDRSERGSDGGGRSSGERSDGGGRASASEDSDERPRTRRRDRGG